MHPGFFGWWTGRPSRGHACAREHAGHACRASGHEGHGHDGHGHEGHGHEHARAGAARCGPRGGRGAEHAGPGGGGDDGGGFGVRRPLRFLAWKLELEEEQIERLAVVLDELKTERAQAAVDHRRSTSAFADAVAGATFDEQKAEATARLRAESAERLGKAVASALARIHAILDDEQRGKLAYLLRTGTLGI
jgi:Spy/CpxP family protein refolding chaperone